MTADQRSQTPDERAPSGPAVAPAAAAGFDRGAAAYEPARPSYPASAVELPVDVAGLRRGRCEIAALVAEHPDTAGRAKFVFPHQTWVSWRRAR
jgi:hypothetical protein